MTTAAQEVVVPSWSSQGYLNSTRKTIQLMWLPKRSKSLQSQTRMWRVRRVRCRPQKTTLFLTILHQMHSLGKILSSLCQLWISFKFKTQPLLKRSIDKSMNKAIAWRNLSRKESMSLVRLSHPCMEKKIDAKGTFRKYSSRFYTNIKL